MIIMLIAHEETMGTRPYFVHVPNLEEGFDFLNALVAKGVILLDIQLMDGSRLVRLPTAAFDGLSSLEPMRQLEAEWTTILAESSRVSLLAQEHTRAELARYDTLLAQIELIYDRLNDFLAFLEQNPSPANERLNDYYQSVLKRNQSQALTIYQARKRLLEDPLC